MQVKLIGGPTGVQEALFGLGLSYGLTSNSDSETFNKSIQFKHCEDIAYKLAHMQGGHNKFLESIQLWLDIKAPRYWWQEFDTYRVGISKQSESTMHTILKREFMPEDFEGYIFDQTIKMLNFVRKDVLASPEGKEQWISIKQNLPESYLQRRIVNVNLRTLQNMYDQRKNHKLKEWHTFFTYIAEGLDCSPYSTLVYFCAFGDNYI